MKVKLYMIVISLRSIKSIHRGYWL